MKRLLLAFAFIVATLPAFAQRGFNVQNLNDPATAYQSAYFGTAVNVCSDSQAASCTSVTTTGLLYNFVDDGNNNYVWRVNPSTAARGPFVMTYQAPIFNGDRDPVIGWGYNMQVGGIRIKPGEPGMGWNLEAYYNDGSGQPKMEAYLQFVNSTGTLATRGIFFSYNRATDRINDARLKASTISFIQDDGTAQGEAGTAFVTFQPAQTIIAGLSTQNTNLIAQAGAARSAVLTLQYNNANATLLYPSSASQGTIQQGSTVPITFFSTLSGDASSPAVVIANGVSRNDAALIVQTSTSANVSRVTAKFTAKASQTGNIIQVENSSQAALWTVDGSGIPTWTSIAEPTCNSTNRGKVTMVFGSAGVADTMRRCAKDAADVYSWTAL